MTYDQWITYGIVHAYCTRAACITHNTDELLEQVEDTSTEQIEWDEPPCLPAGILRPTETQHHATTKGT